MALNQRAGNSSGPRAPDTVSIATSAPSPINPKEKADVDILMSVMSTTDETTALRVLRKHNGDIDRAASAILEGDTGESVKYVPPRLRSPKPQRRAGQGSPVIDLTGEEEDAELARALKASLESVHDTSHVRSVNFGPSDRAPDPNWALVPSNVPVPTAPDPPSRSNLSPEDRTLKRVMQESLNASYNFAPIQESSLEDRVRIDGRPVVLRSSKASLAYASLLIHGLFFIPQMRTRIAAWRPTQPPNAQKLIAPTSGSERALWALLEAHANMDMAYITELESDRTISIFQAKPWEGSTDVTVRDLSRQLLMEMVAVVEPPLAGPDQPRLFSFSYGNAIRSTVPTANSADAAVSKPDPGADLPSLPNITSIQDACVVEVDLDLPIPQGSEDDLISRLSAQLSRAAPGEGKGQQVIVEPSDIVAFQLARSSGGRGVGTSGVANQEPFRYPSYIFLDQFLASNAEMAASKRTSATEMEKDLSQLKERKTNLKWFKGNDTLKFLRSSIYYYENVAQSTDPDQEKVLKDSADKLNKALHKLENELLGLEEQVEKYQAETKALFDTPELQKSKYDLRVVFVHDGLFGRKQFYSYVKDKGVWWKTVDNEVTEVSEETVLTDRTGVHLGAGPYMLLYSCALTPEEQTAYETKKIEWPELLRNSVQHNNDVFLSALRPEVRQRFRQNDSESPSDQQALPSADTINEVAELSSQKETSVTASD